MDILEKIIEAKEKIGDDAAIEIAKYLGVENFDEKNLKGCCPFHHEDTPSFIWNKKDKMFKCFGCQRRYGILDMYTDIEGSYNKALEKLFERTGIKFDLRELKIDRNDFFERYRYPKEEPDRDKSNVYEYYKKRGISKETIDYAGVKEDSHKNCVFELRDLDGELLAVKYRPSHKIKDGEPKMWWQKDADTCPCLYNIDKVDITKPILFVEGYSDVLAVLEAGYKNVVSIPGGAEDLNWIEFNYELLENIEQIILWFDNDRAGEIGRKQAQQRLGEYKCKIVKPSKEDIESVHQYYSQYGADCQKTDANNILLACGKDRIINLIENAEDIPSKKLKYLMDCKIDSVKDMEKTSTGIKALDRILYGNLFPCFTIFSGKTGGGKSSVANIASLIAPVENGYKTFVFSGELGTGQLADWIVSPLAGYNHTQEIISPQSPERPFYVVTNQARQSIQNYYRKSMIVYDDEEALDVSGKSLMDGMEEAYRRYGCRVFLVDNLMCLSFNSLNEDNKWETQKKFIIRLMNFTEKYNVCVNLIIHPKKQNGYAKEPTADDLHGASEMGNLCHRLLWIDRLNPDDNIYNTKITVIKDRPTQAAGKHCELYYDEKTRRLYSDIEEQRKVYSWEKSCNIKYSKEEDEKLIYHRPITSLPHEDSNYEPPY